MKIAYAFAHKDGKFALLNADRSGMISIGPNGQEADRPLDAPIGSYEDCGSPAAVLVYNPTPDRSFVVIPD